MNEAEPLVSPLDVLAIEFVRSLRNGEDPAVDAWADRHPEIADEIQELFPTIASLERVRGRSEAEFDGGEVLQLRRLGDLRIIREIGRGGMGIVYEAEQESLQRRVAVKVLLRQSILDQRHLRRFQREARTAARFHHTNIVPILGTGECDGFHYYVMQKITGISLEKILPEIRAIVDGTQPSAAVSCSHTVPGVQMIAESLLQGRLEAGIDSDSFSDVPGRSVAVRTQVSSPHAESNGQTSLIVTGDFFAQQDAGAASADDKSVTSDSWSGPRMASGYWKSVATVGLQVASALEYAHAYGTMHRDIKPANLIVDLQGTVWVADFGLAKAMERDDVTQTGDVVGTLKYMAPEQLAGQADARSDLYSLGLTLYELASLRPAWDEADRLQLVAGRSEACAPALLRTLNPEIPRDLETIVHRLIATEPGHRYQTAAAAVQDLQRFLDGRPILARRTTVWERFWRWTRRNPALAATSAGVALLLCTVAVMSTVGYLQVSRAHHETQVAVQDEAEQRRKAEANAELALSALDRIFERFAPSNLPVLFAETEDDRSRTTDPAVLSTEAAELLRELVDYYQDLREQHCGSDVYQERIALANRRLGDIHQRLGQGQLALDAYHQSLDVYAELADENSSGNYKTAIAALYIEIGNTWQQTRHLSEAASSYAVAEQLLTLLAKEDETDLILSEMARVYYLQIRSHGPASRRSARGHAIDRDVVDEKLHDAVETMEKLAHGQPEITRYSHLLGLLYLEAASFYGHSDRETAADFHEQAIMVLESLTDDWPENSEFQFSLCGVLAAGNPRARQRGTQYFDAFAERLNQSLSIITTLVESHPQVPRYRAFQSVVHHKMGTVLMNLDYLVESEQHYTAAIDGYGLLSDRFSDASEYYDVKQALARQSLAGLLMKSNSHERLTRARDELQLGIAALENATLDAADQTYIDSRLRGCQRRLAECIRRLERPGSPSDTTTRTTSG